MRTIQILLFLILITLLGAWPFVGTIALVLASIAALLLVLGGVGYLAEFSPVFRTIVSFIASVIAFVLFFGWLAYFRNYISPVVEGTWVENVLIALGAAFLAYVAFDGVRKLQKKYQHGELKSWIKLEWENHKIAYIIWSIPVWLFVLGMIYIYLIQ